jgi:glycerol-3-phosphate acyltransferase PlsY
LNIDVIKFKIRIFREVQMQLFLLLLLSYLLGSVMSALVISKVLRLPDPRLYGSQNPGATNMARGKNKFAAALTFIGDICKVVRM